MTVSKVGELKQKLLGRLLTMLDAPDFSERKDAASILSATLAVVKAFHDETGHDVALVSTTVSKNLSKYRETIGSA